MLMLITNGDLLGRLCLKLRLDLEWKGSYQRSPVLSYLRQTLTNVCQSRHL